VVDKDYDHDHDHELDHDPDHDDHLDPDYYLVRYFHKRLIGLHGPGVQARHWLKLLLNVH